MHNRRGNIKVYSFDVFDTVLTRLVGEPSSLFLPLGQQMLEKGFICISAEAFYYARISAERLAYANHAPASQPNLFEIYRQMQYELGLTDQVVSKIMQAEMDLEREFIRPIPKTAQMIETARRRGGRIIFVSDMYLPASFLKVMLTDHNLMLDGDGLYVSCEYQVSKRSGLLFKKILELETIQPDEMIHCGDHDISDVAVPKKMGVEIIPFRDAHLNRYEKLMETYVLKTMGISSRLAGASRYSRLCVATKNQHEQVIRDVTAGVAAPLLTGYVVWIFEQAQAKGLKRLYFVSRDGEVLLEIAKILKRKLNLWSDIELRYIYGGRQVWHLSSLTAFDENEMSWLLDTSGGVTVRSLLKRCDLEVEDIRSYLDKYQISVDLLDDAIHWKTEFKCQALFEDLDIRVLILKKVSDRRALLLKYFKQEGLLDGVEFGLVDLGWYGRLSSSFNKIIASCGVKIPCWFYFGLNKNITKVLMGDRKTFAFDKQENLGCSELPFRMNAWVEIFCSGTHGSVMGYDETLAGIRPIFQATRNDKAESWGLANLRQAVESFVEMVKFDSESLKWVGVRELFSNLMKAFLMEPELPEVRVWGSFVFSHDQAGLHHYPAAAKLSFSDIWDMLWFGRIRSHSFVFWPQGCYVLTALWILGLMKVARRTAPIFRRVVAILVKVKKGFKVISH